jgi:hypothetical protein
MKNILPILATLLIGLFGTFNIEAAQEQVLALLTGLAMFVTAAWSIYKANKK